jgi:hypothetical protein
VRELDSRKAIVRERTIFAGHSLGGAIAIRTASQFPVAGVIAISPAPMRVAPGFSPEMVPFHDVPVLPPHSLVLTGQWEPGPITALAQELVTPTAAPTSTPAPVSTSKYQRIPGTSHVSILFSQRTFAELRAWTSRLLGTHRDSLLPQNMPSLSCILGIIGLSILVPPFLREMNPSPKSGPVIAQLGPSFPKALLVVTVAALVVALLLAARAIPVHFVRVFNGDYLAVFLFLTGIVILGIFYKFVPALKSLVPASVGSACASALVLVLLFAGWFELTFYEAWLTRARWLRFPLLLLLFLPWHFAEEILLGQPSSSPDLRRLAKAFGLRSGVYVALFLGIQYFHSGAILLFLLLAYFITFSVLQRLACDLVRFRTQSSASAAIFGAILLAAFALVIFPVT